MFAYSLKYHLQGIDSPHRYNSFTKKSMGTELIAGWIYKKGELVKQRMDSWVLGIAAVASLVLTFTVASFLVSSFSTHVLLVLVIF